MLRSSFRTAFLVFGIALTLPTLPVRGQTGTSSEISPTRATPLSDGELIPSLIPRIGELAPIRVESPGMSAPGEQGTAAGSNLVSDSTSSPGNQLDPAIDGILGGPERWTSPEGLSGSLQVLLLLTVLSLAPAVLLMTTCYVRVIVVLGLLRQAIGLPSLPPGQVLTSISLFITMFVMAPVWTQVYDEAIQPYTDPATEMSAEEAWDKGTLPIRNFMSKQIAAAGNHEDVILFYNYASPDSPPPQDFSDVPIRVLLPAYMLSELKTAFLMGFKIYLPFLIVDLVVATVTISMGMLMLPPSVISLPFKLLLFVLVDGWRMVVEMLLVSFGTVPIT